MESCIRGPKTFGALREPSRVLCSDWQPLMVASLSATIVVPRRETVPIPA